MKDTILKKDTLKTVLDTLQSIKTHSASTTTNNETDDQFLKLFYAIGVPLILLVLGWILKGLWDKHYGIWPRVVLKTGKPIYAQRIISYDIGHELTWRLMCELKNNSPITAYNIELWEVKRRKKRQIIDNFPAVKLALPLNNHLDKHEQKDFETRTILHTAPEVLIRFQEINGERVIIPGLKVANPQVALMPVELNDIRLILKYDNEKGRTFYTKFRRYKGKETNKFCRRRPYFFFSVIK